MARKLRSMYDLTASAPKSNPGYLLASKRNIALLLHDELRAFLMISIARLSLTAIIQRDLVAAQSIYD
jgi:hypothetical protein